ncbi:hypothetical protein ACWEHT_14365 [Streptomyces sp. NPDC004646]
MPSTTRLPSASGTQLLEAGHDWDAIRVPRDVGLAALAILGSRCGAVLEDPLSTAGVLYFFMPVGSAETWNVENTRALSTNSSVAIPPIRRTAGPGPRWRICPDEDNWLTDPAALEAAIGDAFENLFSEEQAG